MGRFIDIQWVRASGLRVAEFATAGTDVTANHKGGSAFSPTFPHIRATPTAAYGMQAMGVDNPFGFGVSLVGTDIYFQPFRLTYSVRHYKLFRKKLVKRVYRCWRVLPPYMP